MKHRPSRFTRAIVPLAILGCASNGCSSDDTTVKPRPIPFELTVQSATAVSARNVRVLWAPEDTGFVRIERATGDGPFEQVAVKPAQHGRFLDLALSPETTYRYRVSRCLHASSSDASSNASSSVASSCFAARTLDPIVTPASTIPSFHVVVPPNGTDSDISVFGIETLDENFLTKARMVGVDRNGVVVWEYVREEEIAGPITEVQLLADGTFATGQNDTFVRIELDGTERFRYEGSTAHHDIDPISDGRFIFLSFDIFADELGVPVLGDAIEIIREGDQFPLWTWRARDHISRDDRELVDWNNIMFNVGHDWTHANALTFNEETNEIFVNVRNLNRIYCLSYPSGDVRWILGDGGDFGEGLFSHSHDPLFLSNDRFLVFDNGALRPNATEDYSRIIEVQFDPVKRHAEIVWEYREEPDFYSFAQGAIGVQQNGNIFVADGINRRLFEITREKEKVWELQLPDDVWTYKAITVPRAVFETW